MDKLYFNMIGYQPPSTNDSYIPTSGKPKKGKNGKIFRGAYFRKSDWLNDFQNEVNKMISSGFHHSREEIDEFCKDVIDNSLGVICDIKVSMPRRLYGVNKLSKRDASNFIKPIEDAVYNNFGELDDKFTMDVRSRKYYNEHSEWYFEVTFTKCDSAWNKLNINREEMKVYEYNCEK